MSKYTNDQLNSGTLIGDVDTHGKAWWGGGHFMGKVPFEEAVKLLTVNAEVLPYPTEILPNGVEIDMSEYRRVVDIDTGHVFQTGVKEGYVIHNYVGDVLEPLRLILDQSAGELHIGSVICIENKQQAMVMVRPPEGITVGGDQIMPMLIGASSLDSSWATIFKGTEVRPVCDNTAEMAFRGRQSRFSLRHTKNSKVNIAKAREVVGVFFDSFGDLEKEIDQMQNTAVTTAQFGKVLGHLFPIKDAKGNKFEGAKLTRAVNKQDAVLDLWNNSPMVQPWAGSMWGAVQAVNTAKTHSFSVRGGTRLDRQVQRLVSGETATTDHQTKRTVELVLAGV